MHATNRFRAALLGLCLLLSSNWAHAQVSDGYMEDGKLAAAFCSSAHFKSTQCSLVTAQEASATLVNQCPLCGTAWTDLPDLSNGKWPQRMFGVDRYDQYHIDVVSLACKGRVVVRSVFKLLDEQRREPGSPYFGKNCTSARMEVFNGDKKATPVVRCELELPKGNASEPDRAVRAKEVRCWKCNRCVNGGGCPDQLGRWYSDSYTTELRGCRSNWSKGYQAYRVGIHINPRVILSLAKFEVCNTASCFNQQYEANKLAAAKGCNQGYCQK